MANISIEKVKNSTLFLPDISGFTNFVNNTEISHSQHIVEELLNIIITEGSSNFKIAEIEGDAVFFYKYQDEIDADFILEQANKIYRAFHYHISKYENKRICNCGACTTAVNLKLKFIVHAGVVSMSALKDRSEKPFGPAVIAAHRLLKNNIGLSEYILLSNDFLKNKPLKLALNSHYVDSNLGEIPFNYLEIDEWKESLSPLEIQSSILEVLDLKIGFTKNFDLPINLLHPLISEFRYRHLWHKGADEIIFDEEKINQAGTDHYCIVNDKNLFFETIKPPSGHGQLSYGGVLKNPQPFKYFEADYILTSIDQNKTKLSMFLKASVKWKLQKIFIPIFKIILKKKANQMLGEIEKAIPIYLENLENEVK